jgi:hypothetical protein
MSPQIVKLDRRPAQYDPEARHGCDLLPAGTVRVLDRTLWHDHAVPSLGIRRSPVSEALYKEALQLSPQKDGQRSITGNAVGEH